MTVNTGQAIAKLFRLPDDEVGFAATLQQFGIATVELIILMCLIAWKVIPPARATCPAGARQGVCAGGRGCQTGVPRLPEVVATYCHSAGSSGQPAAIPPPPKPKLASDHKAPAGPIQKIMHDVLGPQRRCRAKLRQAYSRGMSLGASRADDAGPVHGCDNGAVWHQDED